MYISYHSANFGNTADAEAGNIAPIYGVHIFKKVAVPPNLPSVMPHSTLVAAAALAGTNTFRLVATPLTAADYTVNVGQSDNGDGTSDVTVTASYVGSGCLHLRLLSMQRLLRRFAIHMHTAMVQGTQLLGSMAVEQWRLCKQQR